MLSASVAYRDRTYARNPESPGGVLIQLSSAHKANPTAALEI